MNALLLTGAAALLAFPIHQPGAGAPANETRNSTLLETAAGAGNFQTLAAALEAGQLIDALSGRGPFTVFAPTDEAFAKLPQETLQALLRPENRAALVKVLTLHVVAGEVSARDAVGAAQAEALSGGELHFDIVEGGLRVNDARVVANDIDCSNGVIHAIDSVLLPAEGLELEPAGRLIIGIYSESPSRALAEQLGVDRHGSMLVTRVTSGGPAESAGLMKYDVITSVDGEPATDANLKAAKRKRGAGGQLVATVVRKGHPMEITIEVGLDRH